MTSPQPPPWPVGTELIYIGTGLSGFMDEGGAIVCSHTEGVRYTVIEVHPSGGYDRNDEGPYPVHGWSVLQSELDPNLKHGKAIDVDDANDYRRAE